MTYKIINSYVLTIFQIYILNLGKNIKKLFLIESLIFCLYIFLTVVFQDETKVYQLEFNLFLAAAELV